MPRTRKSLLTDLSVADVRRLLALKERIETLDTLRVKLSSELEKVESELSKLWTSAEDLGQAGPQRKTRAKKARKKVMRKKAKKRVTKKTAKKVAKKTGRKKVRVTKTAADKKVAKKVGKKRGKKTTRKSGKRGPTLEDVVATLIARKSGPMAYKDILETITRKKLFASRSSNFDNVLRRTISTSKKLKRVGRGIYDLK